MIYIGYTLILIGSFNYLIGGLGIYRMPDFYNRAQAATKSTTLGTFSILLGVGLINPAWLPKLILAIIFVAITNPVSASALSRSAYLNNVKPTEKTRIDELYDLYNKEEIIND